MKHSDLWIYGTLNWTYLAVGRPPLTAEAQFCFRALKVKGKVHPRTGNEGPVRE